MSLLAAASAKGQVAIFKHDNKTGQIKQIHPSNTTLFFVVSHFLTPGKLSKYGPPSGVPYL